MAKDTTTRRETGAAPRDHYRAVTDRIVAALEAGTIPWRRPWAADVRTAPPGAPCNAASGRPYRGVNAVLLAMTGFAHGGDDPRWVTYRQAAERGWQVRAGERGTPVVFFKRLDVVDDAAEGGMRRVPVLRQFTVFHASQVDGVPAHRAPTTDEAPWRKPEAAELIVAASGVPVRVGGSRAFYSPTLDVIGMPPASVFRTPEGYAAVKLHELAHASGHESRLKRDLSGRFGDRSYVLEELVAELAGVFVGAVLGLPCDIENHASYLRSWLEVLREDGRAIFRAAAAAQKAADWMLALHPDHAARFGPGGAGAVEAEGPEGAEGREAA